MRLNQSVFGTIEELVGDEAVPAAPEREAREQHRQEVRIVEGIARLLFVLLDARLVGRLSSCARSGSLIGASSIVCPVLVFPLRRCQEPARLPRATATRLRPAPFAS